MMLINAFAIVLLVSFCSAFEIDENLQIKEEYLNCFFNKVNISDYNGALGHTSSSNKTEFSEQVKQCVEDTKDSFDLDYITNLSPKVLDMQPPFDLSGHGVSENCRRSSEEFVNSLKNFELWALKSKFINIYVRRVSDF